MSFIYDLSYFYILTKMICLSELSNFGNSLLSVILMIIILIPYLSLLLSFILVILIISCSMSIDDLDGNGSFSYSMYNLHNC